MDVLITAVGLDELRRERRVVLLDVRWSLAEPDGRPAFRAAHLPGAVYVDLGSQLAGHGVPTDGRHPLPAIEDLQAAARSWGVSDGDVVVAYDDSAQLAAARARWLLRWAGVADVRLLDGGLGAWRAAGLPLEAGEAPAPSPGDVMLSAGALPTMDADGAAGFDGILLDARAGERYRGEVEPVDPRAGHIPGAVSAPTADNVGADGRFLSPAELRARFAALDVDPAGTAAVGVYCGSGVTAAHEAAALELIGVTATLFPGSWSAWSADPDRPVATGG